jgi:hypothetical protein
MTVCPVPGCDVCAWETSDGRGQACSMSRMGSCFFPSALCPYWRFVLCACGSPRLSAPPSTPAESFPPSFFKCVCVCVCVCGCVPVCSRQSSPKSYLGNVCMYVFRMSGRKEDCPVVMMINRTAGGRTWPCSLPRPVLLSCDGTHQPRMMRFAGRQTPTHPGTHPSCSFPSGRAGGAAA